MTIAPLRTLTRQYNVGSVAALVPLGPLSPSTVASLGRQWWLWLKRVRAGAA
jgi:hypothetical protein